METKIEVLVQSRMMPTPQGLVPGIQVMFRAEGHKADDRAFILLALEQAKGLIFNQVMTEAAPRVVVSGGERPPA